MGLAALAAPASAVQVNFIKGNLYTATQAGPTSISINGTPLPGALPGDAPVSPLVNGGAWSFSETNMNASDNTFRNNRHEFYFSEDGVNPISLAGDLPWEISFNVALNGASLSPRKTFDFSVFHTGGGADSLINLTTNAPVDGFGDGPTPGESAMFSGQFRFLRLIGVENPPLNFTSLNPTVGYVAGTTIKMRMVHEPGAGVNGGGTMNYFYDNGTTYSTGPQELRIGPGNDNLGGAFSSGVRLGFLLQGIAHASQPNDSYTIQISNFQASIGASSTADFDADGDVDGTDFTIWQRNLGLMSGATRYQGDANRDQKVDAADLAIWRTGFGAATAAVVPEPRALATAAFAAVANVMALSTLRLGQRGGAIVRKRGPSG
jgi:hypothetical protein